jgi:hypothetical protein
MWWCLVKQRDNFAALNSTLKNKTLFAMKVAGAFFPHGAK